MHKYRREMLLSVGRAASPYPTFVVIVENVILTPCGRSTLSTLGRPSQTESYPRRLDVVMTQHDPAGNPAMTRPGGIWYFKVFLARSRNSKYARSCGKRRSPSKCD